MAGVYYLVFCITWLNISMHQKTDNKINHKNLWTVVILKEEILVKNKKLSIQQCTGSLIHSKVVLTAAHCVFNKPKTELRVRAGQCNGRRDTQSTFQQRKIKQIIYQNKQKYDASMPKKDIALIFLMKSFKQSPYIGTVCLLPMPVPSNVQCFVTGWNAKVYNEPGADFKKIDFTILSSDKCQKVLRMTGLGKEFNLHPSFMCAGGKFEKNTLTANGGAPLVCPICGASDKMAQVGVMSWGFKTQPLPEVLTSVSSAYGWITNQLKRKKLSLPDCGFRSNH